MEHIYQCRSLVPIRWALFIKEINMANNIKLSQDEKIIKEIKEDIAGQKFMMTLTNKRLFTSKQTFDLKDVDSVNQEKRLNIVYSFILSSIVTFLVSIIIGGMLKTISSSESASTILFIIAFILWIILLITFLYRPVIVIHVHGRNDQISINIAHIKEDLIANFVYAVMHQKDILLGKEAIQNKSSSSTDNIEKLKQLSELKG